jgi:hypothetical protein
MENLNISKLQADALLKLAGQKLGKSPEELKSQLENGGLNQVIGGLDESTQKKINAIAGDPAAMGALLKNSKLASLLSGLGGGK